MLLTEFNEKKFAKTMWKEGHESGLSEGRASGLSEGRASGLSEGHEDILTIMDEINNGNNTLEKLTALGFDAELVSKVLEKK